MVNTGSEERFDRVQKVFDRAQNYLRHRQFTQAAYMLRLANSLIPTVKREPFREGYASLRTEIGRAASEAYEGVEAITIRKYQHAEGETRKLIRLGVGEATTVDGTEAKKKIKDADIYAASFTGSDFPREISIPMERQLVKISKLKKELESFATDNHLSIDWSKD
ncbi:MAG: hypothetical protein HY051_02310 [Candidatus Aenigmarchaeota archaeon]|nr:hypothetical protein [Candidatus Aenigmarchaeota archaeon]